MKYKVGDKVKLKDNLEVGKKYGMLTLWDKMSQFKGRTGTILNYSGEDYIIKEFGYLVFSDEMLEPVAENNANLDENTDEVSTSSVESKQFTKEDLEFGDILTLRNGDILIYTGIATMRNSEDMEFPLCEYDDTNFEYNHNDDLDIMKVERYREVSWSPEVEGLLKLEILYERREKILTKEEKEWLKNLIRGFKNFKYIKADHFNKWININTGKILYTINYADDLNYNFKNMADKKEYTLEELGL